MELNFVQSSEVFGKNTLAWETEFEATGDFNLHVERNKGGDILVYQRTSGSGYAIVEEFRGMDNKPAIDLDFTSVVYPKFIKIVSESQPTYATVTTDGEITEIKSQSKEIEVTSNGTMDITPDAGFSYLNSVKVKTNVATSGEGGGSASSWKYYDVSGMDKAYNTQISASMGVLVKVEGDSPIATIGIPLAMNIPILAIASDLSIKVSGPNGELMTLKDALIIAGITDELLAQWGAIEITKEEFYNLNA